jgi:hypothetical protein
MVDEKLTRIVAHYKGIAVSGLFGYLFLLKTGRVAAYWEARLGEALAQGYIVVKKPPADPSLRKVHEVAAEVADALTTSETVMVHQGE